MKRVLTGALCAATVAMLGAALPAHAQSADTLSKISSSGKMTFAYRESSVPFSYLEGPEKPIGFAVDISNAIADAVRKQTGKSNLTVGWQAVTSANRIPLLQNGTIDFECGSTTNNRARQKDADFAVTTFVEEVRIAVKADSGITSIKDLNGKNVATSTGTTSVQALRKHERAGGIDFKEVMGKDHAESFLLLETGKADAFVMDGSILAANISRSKNPKNFKIVGEVLAVDPIACMLPKGDAKFKEAVDNSIKRQIKDGSLAKLYNKWFMQPTPPNNAVINLPLAGKTKEAWANPNNKPAEDYKF